MAANARDKTRTLIVWEVPTQPTPFFIEMYINPNNITIQERKLITEQRTKGGYVIQYWGEELTQVSLSGTTGSGSIEAMNVLKDIYRNEQLAMQQILGSQGVDVKRRQSLGQMAASVVMWYQGQGMRGFFKDLNYTEAGDQAGMINYTMNFTVVETIGQRQNFLPWQRKPWSTNTHPSSPDGRGSTEGGAYGTKFKLGEMNAPALSDLTGQFSDNKFSDRTGIAPSQETMRENFNENNAPLTPSSLFAK